MSRTLSVSRMPRIVLRVLGVVFIALGALAAGYGFWAWTASQSYLAEVAASGQVIQALDGASYVMSNGGMYLFMGILLLAHGGIYLVAPSLLPQSEPQRAPTLTEPQPARPEPEEEDEDEDLDTLLEDIGR